MEQWINGTIIFILGLAFGSFLNVLIDRLPQEQSILGRSHCDYCKHTLAWYDLIPLISFLVLGRRCRYCKKSLSWQYPVVEMITGTSFLLISNIKYEISNFFFLDLLILFGIIACLIVIFFADLKYQIIPDSMQVTFFVFALGYKGMGVVGGLNTWLYAYIVILLHSFVAAVVVLAPILFLFLITRGKGMGFGDVKLSFTMGFLLGIPQGLMALYLGFILGAIAGVALIMVKKKKLRSKIAFGPFLVLGTVVMLFWGSLVIEFVRGMFG